MTRPGLLTRIAGSPLGALVLISAGGVFIYGWRTGHSSWVMAFLAVGVIFRTLIAFRRMRAYKGFIADRRAMRSEIEDEPLEKKRRGWLWISVALFLLAAIPASMPHVRLSYPQFETPLLVVWGLVCAYLAWKVLQLVFRAMRGSARAAGAGIRAHQESRTEAQDAAPVTWLISQPSSSPARAEVEKELPAYCVRLLRP